MQVFRIFFSEAVILALVVDKNESLYNQIITKPKKQTKTFTVDLSAYDYLLTLHNIS